MSDRCCQPVVLDPLAFNDALGALGAYSLLRRDATDKTLSMHRLVQVVVQDVLPIEQRKEWMRRVVLAVNTSFPDVQDVDQWAMCECWLPHALVCAAVD
jgi:hypothetical protein